MAGTAVISGAAVLADTRTTTVVAVGSAVALGRGVGCPAVGRAASVAAAWAATAVGLGVALAGWPQALVSASNPAARMGKNVDFRYRFCMPVLSTFRGFTERISGTHSHRLPKANHDFPSQSPGNRLLFESAPSTQSPSQRREVDQRVVSICPLSRLYRPRTTLRRSHCATSFLWDAVRMTSEEFVCQTKRQIHDPSWPLP